MTWTTRHRTCVKHIKITQNWSESQQLQRGDSFLHSYTRWWKGDDATSRQYKCIKVIIINIYHYCTYPFVLNIYLFVIFFRTISITLGYLALKICFVCILKCKSWCTIFLFYPVIDAGCIKIVYGVFAYCENGLLLNVWER